MRSLVKSFLVFILLFVGVSSLMAQHWIVYDASKLPNAEGAVAGADSMIQHSCWDPGDQFTEVIIDDDQVPGNKILYYALPEFEREAAYKWVVDDFKGVEWTMVVRVRGIEGFTDAAQVFDFEIRNGNIGLREKFFINYADNILEFKYADTTRALPEGESVMDWHVYRFTLSTNQAKLYVDEETEPFLAGETFESTSDKYWKIGDCTTGHGNAAYIDWVAWDTTGAYAPNEGLSLPDSLYYAGRPIAVSGEPDMLPTTVLLQQNYPNPFNPTTEISFALPEKQLVDLSVYNVLGEKVKTLVHSVESGGTHTVRFSATDLPAGIYFYTIHAGSQTLTKKMALLK